MLLKDKNIDHINLTVPNLEKSIEFYTKTLGFKMTDRFSDGEMDFVFITNGKIVYELLEDPTLKETKLDHIAYTSKDIQADYDYFKNLNIDLLLGEIDYLDFLFENGVYYFFIKGTGNEKIEFCQMKG